MIEARTPDPPAQRVSVAMATYNGERWVAEQLLSILGQTRTPDQIVVCDDASTDGTLKVVDELAALHPSLIRVIRNTSNVGYILNFERAIEHTDGDIVLLSDQDDIWVPHKIETLLAGLDRSQADLAFSDVTVVDSQLQGTRRQRADVRRSTLADNRR
ncbi:MAG: glycosyltransferase, partial [Actinomycetota bacterium]